MEKTSQRALRNGCEMCGYGKGNDPEKMYYWREGAAVFLANGDGVIHECSTSSKRQPASCLDDAEMPSAAPADPLDAIKAAIDKAVADAVASVTEAWPAPAVRKPGKPGQTLSDGRLEAIRAKLREQPVPMIELLGVEPDGTPWRETFVLN